MLTCLRYFEHVECESPYDYRRLLENATVWICADIKTHYTLGNTTVTRNEGGSSVKVSLGEDNKEKLEIFVSANKQMRDCALMPVTIDHSPPISQRRVYTAQSIATRTGRVFKDSPKMQTLYPALEVKSFSLVPEVEYFT